MNTPEPKSWRVVKDCPRGRRITPPYASFEAAQIMARLRVAMNANCGKPAYARVFPSLAKPAINL